MTETAHATEEQFAKVKRLGEQLDQAIARLSEVQPFAKASRTTPVLDIARRLMLLPGGMDALYWRSVALEAAGIFSGSDWANPTVLQPTMAVNTLKLADTQTMVLECLSEIRLLAVAKGDFFHSSISSEQARHFISQVVALNLSLLFYPPTEAERMQRGAMVVLPVNLYRYIVDQIGYDNILDELIDEVWRILAQRPIQVNGLKAMITQIAACLHDPDLEISGGVGRGADRLVSAVFGPTNGCREDPGFEVYGQRLAAMDVAMLQQEATGFARAMHDTGLVSPYHPVFLRYVLDRHDELIAVALGLSNTGQDSLLCYRELVHRLIDEAIYPETTQAVLGLSSLLERGILHMAPVAPALWRQISLPLAPETEQALVAVFGQTLSPRVYLLGGVLEVLGQPLGIGQGNNPTCQSARALCMWAYNDPDYLLQMLAWAARDGEIVMEFEGRPISSRDLQSGMAAFAPTDVDAVSAVMVPHLDRVYMEMGRLCSGRGVDPHHWINPEFHGWWVGRGFAIAVDVATGRLKDYPDFIRHFYATYHPFYNGGQPVIHPQPAGLAVTDSAARFVGWHAICILRVALDQDGVMRVYFYNPNNDSGQDFGQGVEVSTEGKGERFGESSLPVDQFVSRLYIFHYDALERGYPDDVPAEEIQRAVDYGTGSWAKKRRA